MKSKRVLILEDEATVRTTLFRLLDRKGYNVITAQRMGEAAMMLASEMTIDLALIDLTLPDGDGVEFMTQLKNKNPQTEVIMLASSGSVENAILATQKGAFHYVTKPVQAEELLGLVEKALTGKKQEPTRAENSRTKYKFDQIVGQSEGLQQVLDLVSRVADSDSTVLVHGESGTGKELIARAIHHHSTRNDGPFVAINCGAIPSELLESELFGHVKGAFTGAISNRVGRFELADSGTLFLDEIGDLEPSLQVKILRALQERCFEPVGSTKTVTVNVRVIAATNINLDEAVNEGKFREDLYYRLNVIPVNIPPLRERQTDIPLLLQHFTAVFNKSKNRGISGVSPEAMEYLMNYEWPGNIRELENFVERMCILKGHGLIEIHDLPVKYRAGYREPQADPLAMSLPDDGLDFNSAVDAFENALILRALERTGWNRNQAAMLLRLNRTTLVEKIKKKGLRPADGQIDADA